MIKQIFTLALLAIIILLALLAAVALLDDLAGFACAMVYLIFGLALMVGFVNLEDVAKTP